MREGACPRCASIRAMEPGRTRCGRCDRHAADTGSREPGEGGGYVSGVSATSAIVDGTRSNEPTSPGLPRPAATSHAGDGAGKEEESKEGAGGAGSNATPTVSTITTGEAGGGPAATANQATAVPQPGGEAGGEDREGAGGLVTTTSSPGTATTGGASGEEAATTGSGLQRGGGAVEQEGSGGTTDQDGAGGAGIATAAPLVSPTTIPGNTTVGAGRGGASKPASTGAVPKRGRGRGRGSPAFVPPRRPGPPARPANPAPGLDWAASVEEEEEEARQWAEHMAQVEAAANESLEDARFWKFRKGKKAARREAAARARAAEEEQGRRHARLQLEQERRSEQRAASLAPALPTEPGEGGHTHSGVSATGATVDGTRSDSPASPGALPAAGASHARDLDGEWVQLADLVDNPGDRVTAQEEADIATAVRNSLADLDGPGSVQQEETGVGAGGGPVLSVSNFSSHSTESSSQVPLPPAQPAASQEEATVGEAAGEEAGDTIHVNVVVFDRGGRPGLRVARLRVGPAGVVPVRPHPLSYREDDVAVAGNLAAVTSIFRGPQASGILSRLWGAIHTYDIPPTAPALPPSTGDGEARFASEDIRDRVRPPTPGQGPAPWNLASVAEACLSLRDGPDGLAGHFSGTEWEKVQAATRLARSRTMDGAWAGALAAWQSVVRQLAADPEGLWRLPNLRERLETRLAAACDGVARCLLFTGREEELATWSLPAGQAGLLGAAGWGVVARGLAVSREGRYLEAYAIFREAHTGWGDMPGGPDLAAHLAAQQLHHELAECEPLLARAEEKEAERDRDAGRQRQAMLGGLVPVDQPYPPCPECRAPTALGPGGRHVCDAIGRLAYGARQYGDSLVPVADFAATINKCAVGGTDTPEPGCAYSLSGREVLACRGPSQDLLCRECLAEWEKRPANRGTCCVCRYETRDGSSAYLPVTGNLARLLELAGRVAGLARLDA